MLQLVGLAFLPLASCLWAGALWHSPLLEEAELREGGGEAVGDCSFYPWFHWSPCPVSCGGLASRPPSPRLVRRGEGLAGGIRARERLLDPYATNESRIPDCPTHSAQREPCASEPCRLGPHSPLMTLPRLRPGL